jgi:hypothetical protein
VGVKTGARCKRGTFAGFAQSAYWQVGEIPRDSYPEGREPYLQWRKHLAKHHAAVVTAILQQVGYGVEQISKVAKIILKQRIKADAEVQIMENALCMVFLEFQYEDFHPKQMEMPA